MSLTFNNEPVIDLVRNIVAQQAGIAGDDVTVIPDDYIARLYSSSSFAYPLYVLRVEDQQDVLRKPCIFDVSHYIKFVIYNARLRQAVDAITENVAADNLAGMAAYFSDKANIRLGGNVQEVEVVKRATGSQAAMGVDFIPQAQLESLAIASLEIHVCWIESRA